MKYWSLAVALVIDQLNRQILDAAGGAVLDGLLQLRAETTTMLSVLRMLSSS